MNYTKSVTEELVSTEYHVYSAFDCERCGEEHIVSGYGTDKRKIGLLKNDLNKILTEDYPQCAVKAKAALAATWTCIGIGRYKNGTRKVKWVRA